MTDGATFDCFLSHNSRDKPAVRALAVDLRARGVSVWLDEERLRPGLPWQELLEEGIHASRSVAVLVGKDGLGPWEQQEMRAALNLAVRDGRPVIPVLLADAPHEPRLPPLLAERTWVDLRPSDDPGGLSGLDRLLWGITGRRPGDSAKGARLEPPTLARRPVLGLARRVGAGVLVLALVALGAWAWHRLLGGPSPLERFSDGMKIGGQAPAMIALPAGCFQMGSPPDEPERDSSEGPQHRVCLPAFAIGRTEVTFAQYDRFADATGQRKPDDNGWGRGDRPVINVGPGNAAKYADWLSVQTGHEYRLPSEAEWEYAARAGTKGPFWTGGCIATDLANYNGGFDYAGCGAKTGVYRRQTVSTGSLPASSCGLHEVAGNVWEWVQGCEQDAGSAFHGDCARVARGGSWNYDPRALRSASRIILSSGTDIVGFRLARTL